MLEFEIDTEHPVIIPCEDVHLDGLLHIPSGVRGMVIFAHGSGSSRFSQRNQFIAKELQEAKFATLLFDLLTHQEEEIDNRTMEYRFDINFLSARLLAATNWILTNPILNKLPIGYFGASTGGGAALVAAAQEQDLVKAVVSRGGRPDLAGEALKRVKAATLLIVGGNDEPVIELNEKAYEKLPGIKKIEIVPGATHLFEEPGKLSDVARLAINWFDKYLVS
nr:alpha/beta fold hydrolase [Aquicella lusitana]